ncbi:MAG: efflux RND transporter periplasmic adaptor subunit [Gemmatimonadetes bacterium]|nr:efflux RND transporter periplasmic adaptor subunit [Gemmatimonadota bacterium]
MKSIASLPVLLIGLVLACGSSEEEPPMEGMSAQEHAMMMAGGTQGETDSTGATVRQSVHLTAAQEQALGVVYTMVRRGTMTRTIRTVGVVAAAEPNITDITPKVDGFVEELLVDYTGQKVRRGQPLLRLYSPTLVAAQEELLTAIRLASRVGRGAGEAWRNAQSMLDAARRRLAYFDITPEQIEQVETTGRATKTLTLVAPFTGVVLEKHVVEGQRVTPGMQLYRLADLSTVWVEGEVFEQDLQYIRIGAQAHIEVAAYPGEHLMGAVSFVYPVVDVASRTNRVRVTVPNLDGRLKPGMFSTMFFDTRVGEDVIIVPFEAVIVTGERNLVFVRDEDGMLQPREVVLGARADREVQILSGLTEGETIVASANFLIDAESRLGTTGGTMPGTQHGGDTTGLQQQPTEQQHD